MGRPSIQLESDIDSRVSLSLDEKSTTFETTASGSWEQTPNNGEVAKSPLQTSIWALLLSLWIHIMPTVITIILLWLLVTNRYWFDNTSASSPYVWWMDSINFGIDANEVLNILQFAGKFHEILLAASISAIILHFFRSALLGSNGLPLGLLSSGYGVESVSNIFSRRTLSSLQSSGHRVLAVMAMFGTILALFLGPASNIILIPKLDWFKMAQAFGDEDLPIYTLDTNIVWPPTLGAEQAFVPLQNDDQLNSCSSSENQVTGICPGSGFPTMLDWTNGNANQNLPSNITMSDRFSGAQRVVTSGQYIPDMGSSVSIATSLSHTSTTIFGSFWRLIRWKNTPASHAARPRLTLPSSEQTYQPLVQVECTSTTATPDNKIPSDFKHVRHSSINTFAAGESIEWSLPESIYDESFNPVTHDQRILMKQAMSTNLHWVDTADDTDASPSIGVVISTPFLQTGLLGTMEQHVLIHTCSIDARWIASHPIYNPKDDSVVGHNITDPLVFGKPPSDSSASQSPIEQKKTWGVSDKINLQSDWANLLNIPINYGDDKATYFQWMMWSHISTGNKSFIDNSVDQYHFFPNTKLTLGQSSTTVYPTNLTQYGYDVSSTVATALSLLVTDGIARTSPIKFLQDMWVVTSHPNDTYSTIVPLEAFASTSEFSKGWPVETTKLESIFDNHFTFDVQRYGYGYSLRTTTVKVAFAALVLHALIALAFMCYAAWDFFWGQGWTTSTWNDISELATLLVNSRPTQELDNTCAGIGRKGTFKKVMWIRESSDEHLGVVVGDKKAADQMPRIRKGLNYGALARRPSV